MTVTLWSPPLDGKQSGKAPGIQSRDGAQIGQHPHRHSTGSATRIRRAEGLSPNSREGRHRQPPGKGNRPAQTERRRQRLAAITGWTMRRKPVSGRPSRIRSLAPYLPRRCPTCAHGWPTSVCTATRSARKAQSARAPGWRVGGSTEVHLHRHVSCCRQKLGSEASSAAEAVHRQDHEKPSTDARLHGRQG